MADVPDMTATTAPAWFQAGSTVALVGLVYFEMRTHRAELREMRRVVARIGEALAVLLDRVGGRTRAPTSPVTDAKRDDEDDGA